MLKERIITSTDINFIKTLIELNHEKIVEIEYKDGIERITSIVNTAKAKGVCVSKSSKKDLKILCIAIVIGGTLMAIIGIGQFYYNDSLSL